MEGAGDLPQPSTLNPYQLNPEPWTPLEGAGDLRVLLREWSVLPQQDVADHLRLGNLSAACCVLGFGVRVRVQGSGVWVQGVGSWVWGVGGNRCVVGGREGGAPLCGRQGVTRRIPRVPGAAPARTGGRELPLLPNAINPAPVVGRRERPAPLRGAGQGDRGLVTLRKFLLQIYAVTSPVSIRWSEGFDEGCAPLLERRGEGLASSA